MKKHNNSIIIINIITLLCISLVSTQNDTLNQNEEYKIITEDVIDEMLDSISYIKLNTYIKLNNEA